MFGCTGSIGPGALRTQRADYNSALQETNDRQLPLNLVRLRYGETPSFLEVTGIVTLGQRKFWSGAVEPPDWTGFANAYGTNATVLVTRELVDKIEEMMHVEA